MFAILVAADVFGNKTNFELVFPDRPSVAELTRATEKAFSDEISLRRPEGVPHHSFHVLKLKLWDEDRNKWLDVTSDSMLVQGAQCYAFQPETPWHKETQKEIPKAVRPPSAPMASSTTSSRPPAIRESRPSATASSSRPPVRHVQPFANPDATEDEKIRTVFAEFDNSGTRMIDLDALKQGFRTLGLDFTSATMNDLFQKGDLNSDGRISYGEFERFAHLYPIMIDCLFYRSKAFWDDQNMQREIDGDKEAVRQAEQLAHQAENNYKNAQKAVEDAGARIQDAEADNKGVQNRQRDTSSQLDQLQREKERTAKEKYDKENDAVSMRDRERAARQSQNEIVRDLEKIDRKLAQQQQEAQKADDKVKQLEQQLAEARRQAERANSAMKSTQSDVDTLRARERDATKNADSIAREIPRADDSLRQAENNHNIVLERIRELEMLQRDLARDKEEADRRRDGADRELAQAKDREAQAADEWEQAKRDAERREREAREREAELLEEQKRRQLVSQQERQLIEQELRLVEQRESLEEKEGRLKTEASSVLGNIRRQQSYSRGDSRY